MKLEAEQLKQVAEILERSGASALTVKEVAVGETQITIERDEVLSMKEAAAFLKLSPATLRRMVDARMLTVIQFQKTGTMRFQKSELIKDLKKYIRYSTYNPVKLEVQRG